MFRRSWRKLTPTFLFKIIERRFGDMRIFIAIAARSSAGSEYLSASALITSRTVSRPHWAKKGICVLSIAELLRRLCNYLTQDKITKLCVRVRSIEVATALERN